MLLEILVGFKVVLSLKKYQPILDLFDGIKAYTDKDTYEILRWLLFKEGKADLKAYIQGPLSSFEDLIAANISKIKVGMREFYELAELKEQSELIWKLEKKQLCQRFKINENLV